MKQVINDFCDILIRFGVTVLRMTINDVFLQKLLSYSRDIFVRDSGVKVKNCNAMFPYIVC